MKELNHISAETLISYKEMFEYVHNKHGKNYKKSLEELTQLKKQAIDFFEVKIKELVEYSNKCTPKPSSELINVMQQVGKGSQKDNDLHQAAFYSAIGNEGAAKQQHLKNMLNDTEILYSIEINKLKHKLMSKSESECFGAVGGGVFAKKSEEAVYLTLDLWRQKYQGFSNTDAASFLLDIVNEKRAELNSEISNSRNTNNTPMLEISDIKSLTLWIGALKALINGKPIPKRARKCIQNYYDNYYLNDTYYFPNLT